MLRLSFNYSSNNGFTMLCTTNLTLPASDWTVLGSATITAARSDGDYRLYDASDLDRLQFIRSLRDDAGFSLAQIGQLLEDDAARERNRERYRQTGDPDERRALVVESRARTEHQIEILETKAARLATMIEEARARARHLDAHLAELDGGPPPHPERVSAPSEPKPRSRS